MLALDVPGMQRAFAREYGLARWRIVKAAAMERHARWLAEGWALSLATNWQGTVYVQAEEPDAEES